MCLTGHATEEMCLSTKGQSLGNWKMNKMFASNLNFNLRNFDLEKQQIAHQLS